LLTFRFLIHGLCTFIGKVFQQPGELGKEYAKC